MKWQKVLPEDEIIHLLRLGEPWSPKVGKTPVYLEGGQGYRELPATDTIETLAAKRRVARNGAVSFLITAKDSFFSVPSILFLGNNGWTEKDIAIFGIMHELAHLITWSAPSAEISGLTQGEVAWRCGYAAWPLETGPELPKNLAARSSGSFIEKASPSGAFRSLIAQATDASEVAWAQNLSELRADAMASVLCFMVKDSLLRNHPFKRDFPAALQVLAQSRLLTQATNSDYTWGPLKTFLDKVPCLTEPKDSAIALAEQAAWSAANENWPILFNAIGSAANFYAVLAPRIPSTAISDAAAETTAALNCIDVSIDKYKKEKEAKNKNGFSLRRWLTKNRPEK